VFYNGGTIGEVTDVQLGKVLEYKITQDQPDVRVQVGRSGPPIEPPYSITVKVKLGDTFNISSGGGVNFVSAMRDVSNQNDPTLIAGIDFGYRFTGNLRVKMPPSDNPDKKGNPGNNYKQYSGYTPLRKGVWETIEFRVDGNGILEYWLNGSLEARGLSYLAEKGAQGDNLVAMHAGNIYGSRIAKDSVIWRGPVEIRKFNATK
jgi:hypothetical protein